MKYSSTSGENISLPDNCNFSVLLLAWSLATVVGSAWATNIPLNFGPFQQCSYDVFNNRVINPTWCRSGGLPACLLYLFDAVFIGLERTGHSSDDPWTLEGDADFNASHLLHS